MHLRAYDKTHRPRVRPATDIVERPDGIFVLVNLPGVAREDLTVEADHRQLSIRGISRYDRSDRAPGGEAVLALEFVEVEYEMRIALSSAQDSETIRAHLKNAAMKANRVMIAHCPTSNENVIAGIAPAAKYLRGGWRIGLGSDVAGGHTLDLFAVMAAAVQVSKLRWRYVDQSEAPLTMTEALYLATVGGGEFWQDFGEQVGLFEPGYAFDALVLDDSHLRSLRSFTPAKRLERYAYLGKGALSAKFAQGKKLF